MLAGLVGSAIASHLVGKGLSAVGLKEGGRVEKEGLYHLHKGEVVVPASIVNKKAPKTKMTAKPKAKAGHKGAKSKTHKGDKDYTTKRGDKDFHRKGKDVKAKRKPFAKKAGGKGKGKKGKDKK